ncbi:MAG: oxygen-independent coproporphyrinogen III oxidase [Bacteroidaceae bacterium]|nr:oxygen-independent coproporphyrinogen III oxidase [Bacteroidaceae bacterium]
MVQEIIDKYNVSTPRYTSYPPANYFDKMSSEDFIADVDKSNEAKNDNISFYIHMPFCRRLCLYCGCNSYPMSDKHTVDEYIKALHKEIDLVAKHISPNRKISQIHYGGGSPTAIATSELKALNEHMLSLFPTIENPEIAIECHPGFLTEKEWGELLEYHFNRFSIGVQDTKPEVLKAVNRQEPEIPLKEIFNILRSRDVSINMDFLFGLPYQTPESFAQSVSIAKELRPDRLVTFSYGHVPWVFKRQQVLERIGLPKPEDKNRMFTLAAQTLEGMGYNQLGMDHFVLPTDELYIARQQKMLRRNFQGYCTLRTTGQVYAFGVSGISQLDGAYAQNGKDIPTYIDTINNGDLYVQKGYRLTDSQKVVREVIEALMCNYHVDFSSIAQRLGLKNATEVKSCCNYDIDKLKEMESDGIISLTDDSITLTDERSPFVRNVAAALDPMMLNTTRQFSKPI